MIFPLSSAFPVSQSSDGVTSGESFISRKDAHSSLMNLSNSGSSSKEVLKRHLLVGLLELFKFQMRVTGVWSLIVKGCIWMSEICEIIELLARKKSIRE